MIFLDEIFKKLLELGIDNFKESSDTETLRQLVRENLKRELIYNQELLSEVIKMKGSVDEPAYSCLIAELSFSEFESFSSHHLPFSVLLSDDIQVSSRVYRKYKYKLDNFRSSSELIERTYHRIKILRFRAKSKLSRGDVGYVIELIRFSISVLRL